MKRNLKNMDITREEAEWRQRVAQCHQKDAGWTFFKLLFENTLRNDERRGHILSVQFLPVLSITYFVIGQIQKFFEV